MGKKKKTSTVQLTTKVLRLFGVRYMIVERWIAPPGRKGFRQDLFGFGDVLALNTENQALLAIQATSMADAKEHMDRYAKNLKVRDAIIGWIVCKGTVQIWAWGPSQFANEAVDIYDAIVCPKERIAWSKKTAQPLTIDDLERMVV